MRSGERLLITFISIVAAAVRRAEDDTRRFTTACRISLPTSFRIRKKISERFEITFVKFLVL
jgi:hypothetical protein